MSRRGQPSEMQFGSDSFLDVLANMVGILIILIVIAGARVGRAPVPSLLEIQARQTAEPTAVAEIAETRAPPVEPEEVEIPPEPTLEPDEAAPEIASELQEIQVELATLKNKRGVQVAALERMQNLENEVRRHTSAGEQAALAKSRDVNAERQRVEGLKQTVVARKQALRGLLAEFEEVKQSQPAVKQVSHHLTPISQAVTGEELHFRLSGNRIAFIPLTDLLERVKLQLERRKDWFAKSQSRRHEGTVGPTGGFSVNYRIERQQISVLDELRYGQGVYRIAVTWWEVVPERDLEAETAEQALQRGSRFAAALQAAEPKASLTFWVYPDSFALYRQLQSAAHAEGFVVSARPLPAGYPIAGSPHGSKSAGQ